MVRVEVVRAEVAAMAMVEAVGAVAVVVWRRGRWRCAVPVSVLASASVSAVVLSAAVLTAAAVVLVAAAVSMVVAMAVAAVTAVPVSVSALSLPVSLPASVSV